MRRVAERRATVALGEPFSRPKEQQSGVGDKKERQRAAELRANAECRMSDMENIRFFPPYFATVFYF